MLGGLGVDVGDGQEFEPFGHGQGFGLGADEFDQPQPEGVGGRARSVVAEGELGAVADVHVEVPGQHQFGDERGAEPEPGHVRRHGRFVEVVMRGDQ
ncbi:hypothetical protein GCM10029992_62340 [Glycomyces albus]